MDFQADPAELTERIQLEARRHRGDATAVRTDSPEADTSSLPPAPVFTPALPGGFSCESLLAQTAAMVERARTKTTVRKSVPRLLRAFWRNQGGYNDIVLEALERLREANRLLMVENVQLRGHVQRQTEWMDAANRVLAGLGTRLEALERREPSSGS